MEQTKSRNITWHTSDVTRAERAKRIGHRGATVWLTGLSASGKSTLAKSLEYQLNKRGCLAYVLDGDNMRHGLNRDLGFSPEDRKENIRRFGEVARLFTDAGVITICALISPYGQDRDFVRSIVGSDDFIEVYVYASLQTCEARDPKGLYKRARAGQIQEFTGISAPYEEPENAEITIDTEKKSPEQGVAQLLEYLERDKRIG